MSGMAELIVIPPWRGGMTEAIPPHLRPPPMGRSSSIRQASRRRISQAPRIIGTTHHNVMVR
jgi:hypothetical protein